MSINQIKLPSHLLVSLYADCLVEEKKTTNSISQEDVKFLGGNANNILVLITKEATPLLPKAELTFLTGILSACQLTLADVAIVNLAHNPATWKEFVTQYNSKVFLLFGVKPSLLDLPINFPPYQLQPHAHATFLYAPSLQQLESDKLEKSKLWVCLKRLFNL